MDYTRLIPALFTLNRLDPVLIYSIKIVLLKCAMLIAVKTSTSLTSVYEAALC